MEKARHLKPFCINTTKSVRIRKRSRRAVSRSWQAVPCWAKACFADHGPPGLAARFGLCGALHRRAGKSGSSKVNNLDKVEADPPRRDIDARSRGRAVRRRPRV